MLLTTNPPVSGSAPSYSAVVAIPTLGPWQLAQPLGEGAWTRVYRARPSNCAQEATFDYAIKTLRAEHRDDPLAIGLIKREATVAREVIHPHLISILSAHTARPPYFLTMPYLQGTTLRSILNAATKRQGSEPRENQQLDLSGVFHPPVAVSHAIWIVRQAAEALRALHAAGWTHGDVKPSNLFVSPLGHTTLIDLGFAQRIHETEEKLSDGLPSDFIAGTPDYAAPEKFHNTAAIGCPKDRADIYSLGATLFEILTGTRPSAELPADPRCLVPRIPPRVGRLVAQMLATEPATRPNSSELVMRLFQVEIEAFANGRDFSPSSRR